MATGGSELKILVGPRTESEDSQSSTDETVPLTSSSSGNKYGINAPSSPQRQVLSGLQGYLSYWKTKFRWPWNREKPTPPPRTIYFNSREKNGSSVKFCSNRISTTKYNMLTFLPRFLFDQFRRYANLFFLIIAGLQQIDGISPTGRFTTIVPLTLVLLATAAKEIIEDLRRWKADNRVNNSKVEVLRNEVFETISWKKVVVGDIVRIQNHQFFPADLIILSTSEPQGICYVETSNLDGETNLKIRQAHLATTQKQTEQDIANIDGFVECEGPNNRLYEFTGNINIGSLQPILSDQVLLRGSQLRNTQWIIGLVVYTGHDSKLLQNATTTPLKRSRMDRVTNKQVIFLVCILVFLAVLSSLGSVIWNNPGKTAGQFFLSILTFIILYNNLIPISLIVTLEVLKFVQSFFINWDLDIYDPKSDTPALVRNSNLNEELGQVRYVFADKTGTLTENVMEFKKCSISGKLYKMSSEDPPEESGSTSTQCLSDVVHELSADTDSPVLEFLKVLAVCHTVIPEDENGCINLRASSPDEEALVKAAISLGIRFRVRTPTSVIVDVLGKSETYEVLNLLEFNSDRKRMSVIVRTPDGSIKLFCKGADSVILPRLVVNDGLKAVTENHLTKFAKDGLRTLCVAQATIPKEFYQNWANDYHVASTALDGRERKLDEAAEMIEKDLCLLGATAVEDKLQEGVPESIAKLRSANIKVWVLTGDKQETAINIGVSSKQLTTNMHIIIVNHKSLKDVKDQLMKEAESNLTQENALVIDGKSLAYALEQSARGTFLKVALRCKSVICCRVSPLQKAEVVRLVRSEVKDSITLAIGDGANDVSMIQAAHVGVGISGKEGLQATLASDYAIAQFRFLLKLLLVHGVWNYNRLAKIILFSFYKNICLYTIEFWFAFFNGFSGQPIFERWTIALFNVLFTFVPTITFGLFEQDTTARARLEVPTLFIPSQQGKYFNSKVFWKWVGLSIFHSLFLFFFVYFILHKENPLSNGQVVGLWYVGNTIYTCVVITVNLKLALESQYWTWLHHVAVWGSILTWYIFLAIYPHFWPGVNVGSDMIGQDRVLYGSLIFYALALLTPVMAMLPDFLWTVWQQTVNVSEVEKVRQDEKKFTSTTKGSYQRFSEISVSYSPRVSKENGEEFEGGLTRSLSYVVPSRGYAFSQEDHGVTKKGSRLQRRDMIKMNFYGN